MGGGSVSEPRPIRKADEHAAGSGEESVGELVKDLIQDVADLVRAEIRLARQEITEDASRIGVGIAFAAAGGVVAFVGFICLIFAAIYALGTLIGTALAAAIVGVVVLIAGGIVALVGVEQVRSSNPAPDRTISAVKEDAEWLKNRMS
jgi:uncharacterized membrane protein YqjE